MEENLVLETRVFKNTYRKGRLVKAILKIDYSRGIYTIEIISKSKRTNEEYTLAKLETFEFVEDRAKALIEEHKNK